MKVLLLALLAASVTSEEQLAGLQSIESQDTFFPGPQAPGSEETYFQQPSSAATPLDLRPFLAPIYLQYAPDNRASTHQQSATGTGSILKQDVYDSSLWQPAAAPPPQADSFFRQPASTSTYNSALTPEPTFQHPDSAQTYNQQPASSPDSIFQQPDSAQTYNQQPASSPDSIFQQPASSPDSIFQQPASSPDSIFQQPASSPDSIFQQPASAPVSGSIFRQPTPAPIFRQRPTATIFQQPSPAPTPGSNLRQPTQHFHGPAPQYEGSVQYDFSYNIDAYDPEGNKVEFGHQEERNDYETSGSYFVLLPDKRLMNVKYHADETGFHPIYTYEDVSVQPQPITY